MFSHRRIVFRLIIISLLLLAANRVAPAQEETKVNRQIESDAEMLGKVEEDVQLLTSEKFVGDRQVMAIRADRQLKKILQLYPDTPLRDHVKEALSQVEEILGLHDLQLAQFYFNLGRGGAMEGAQSRLQQIIREYPNFSRMDEVLLLLGKVYLKDEQMEAAVNYFRKLVCQYPTSKNISEAFEQLNKIGFDASKGCDNSMP
jgi:outer membrane protein assembly factor BamD (BamD/ComL family)